MRWKMVVLLGFSALAVVLASSRLLHEAENGQLRMAAGEGIAEAASVRLTDSNLVDMLSALPLHLDIARVDLRGTLLAVDLKVRSSSGGTAPIYEDMAEVAEMALLRCDNIGQLRLRLVAEDPWTASRHLLLASEVSRYELADDAEEVLQELKTAGDNPLNPSLKERLHIVETALWKKSYPEPDI